MIAAVERAGNKRLRIVLDEMSLVSLEGSVALLAVSDAMRPNAAGMLREITGLLRGQAGVELDARLTEPPSVPAATAQPEAPRAPVTEHPLVKQAMELFGAKVIRVQPRPER